MIDNLSVQTAQIYDYLSRGNLLRSNANVEELGILSSTVEDNLGRLRDYFPHINFVLEQENNYFYFSRKGPQAILEQKLQRFFTWIDTINFLCTYDTAFGSGFTFLSAEILARSRTDTNPKMELDGLKKHTGGRGKRKDILDTILDRTTKEGSIKCISNMNGT